MLNKGKEIKLMPSDSKAVGYNKSGIDLISSGKRELKVSGFKFLKKKYLTALYAKGNLSLTNRFLSNNFGISDLFYPLSLPFNNLYLFSSQRFSKLNSLVISLGNLVYFSLLGKNNSVIPSDKDNFLFSFFNYNFLFRKLTFEMSYNYYGKKNYKKIYNKIGTRWFFFYKKKLPKFAPRIKWLHFYELLIEFKSMKLVKFLPFFRVTGFMFNKFTRNFIINEMTSFLLFQILFRKRRFLKYVKTNADKFKIYHTEQILGKRYNNYIFKPTIFFIDTYKKELNKDRKFVQSFTNLSRQFLMLFGYIGEAYSYDTVKYDELSLICNHIRENILQNYNIVLFDFKIESFHNLIFFKKFYFIFFLIKILIKKGINSLIKPFYALFINLKKTCDSVNENFFQNFLKKNIKQFVMFFFIIFDLKRKYLYKVILLSFASFFRSSLNWPFTEEQSRNHLNFFLYVLKEKSKKILFYKGIESRDVYFAEKSKLKNKLLTTLKRLKFKVKKMQKRLKRKRKFNRKEKKFLIFKKRRKRKQKIDFKIFRRMFIFSSIKSV